MTWTIPPTADLQAFLADLEPVAAALLAVGVASVLMLLVGLILLVRRRRRRKVAARAAQTAATAALRRDPAIRRSTPSPLFTGRGEQADVLGSTLQGTTGVLGVLRALEAADRAEPSELGPPLPRWLDTGPEDEIGMVVEPGPDLMSVLETVGEPESEQERVAKTNATPALALARSVDTRAPRQPRPERARIEPWMVVAGAALFVIARRRRPRRPPT